MANAIEILINARDNASPALDRATVSVASLAKGVLASVGAFAAIDLSMRAVQQAAVGISKGFADEVEQLDRLHAITGLSNEQLQIFRRGLERNGLEANQLGLALRFFQNQLAGSHRDMVALGISSMDTFGALVQLKGALDAAGTDAERTEIASKTLGMRNVELAQTVTDVAANYNTEFALAMGRGAMLAADMQDNMRSLDTSLDDFMDTVRAAKIGLANLFGPALQQAVELLNTVNALLPKLKDYLQWGANGMMNPGMMFPAHASTLPGAKAAAAGGGGGGGFSFADYGTAGPTLAQRDSTPQHLMDLGKNLRLVDEPALKLKDDLVLLREATVNFGYNLQGTFYQTFQSIVSGTQNIRQAFDTMLRGIMQSIADAIIQMMARLAASYAIQGLGSLIPGPWGAAISGAGKLMRGASASPAGGNTFVIQSISAKDALQSLVSPTGSLRNANDRMREVAMAGSL